MNLFAKEKDEPLCVAGDGVFPSFVSLFDEITSAKSDVSARNILSSKLKSSHLEKLENYRGIKL